MVRVDGTLRKLAAPPLDDAAALALIEASMTEAQRQAFAEDGESDFSLAVPGVARFRVNAFRQNRGPGGVPNHSHHRAQPEGSWPRPPLSSSPGPGAGRGPRGPVNRPPLRPWWTTSTTRSSSTFSPLRIPSSSFTPPSSASLTSGRVHRDTASFSRALRAALREDPDVIMVGELRDLETIRTALEAAETGHVVCHPPYPIGRQNHRSPNRRLSRIGEGRGARHAVRIPSGRGFPDPP